MFLLKTLTGSCISFKNATKWTTNNLVTVERPETT